MAASLDDAGHESPVITLDSPSAPWLTTWRTPIIAAGPAHSHFGWTPRLQGILKREAERSDLIVVHGLWQYHGVAACRIATSLRKPYFVYPHGMLDPWALRQSLAKNLIKKLNWSLFTKLVLQKATRICFTCDEEKLAAQPALQGLKTETAILPLGVEGPPDDVGLLRQEWQSKHPDLSNRRIVVFLGRLHPKKGCDLLLQGYARWRTENKSVAASTQLRMVGPAHSPDYLRSLQEICHTEGLEPNVDVCLPGMISGRGKWQELAASEALILPSHQENFGIVVGESLACGRPVLLSKKVNTWRWPVESHAGFAAEPTAEGVQQLFDAWFALSSSGVQEMSHRARKLYEDSFSTTGTTQTFLKACRESLA
jgi:glycosyltransferase involved in cell wall biosynthesis